MVKERVSLTLDRDVIDRVDRRLEREGIDNRSQGIEQILRDHLARESVSTAVVLGGGPDSDCLIPINGRPVIAYALDHLEEAGVDRVIVATGDPAVAEAVDDGREFALEVLIEEEPLGTAGALREVGRPDDTFLVMNGDVLCEVDIGDMRKAHDAGDGLATMALTTVSDAADYGVVRMKGNRIVGFTEKPDESFSHLINAGIYLVEPAFLDRIPPRDEQVAVDIEALFEDLARDGQLTGYVYDGEWRDVG